MNNFLGKENRPVAGGSYGSEYRIVTPFQGIKYFFDWRLKGLSQNYDDFIPNFDYFTRRRV